MPPPHKWTLEKIKQGFDEYLKTYGRYPTALDIDKYGPLPSSRQIQRKFGGLIKLRESLGFPEDFIDFTQGKTRSDTARKTWKRGIGFERQVYQLLVQKFGEMFVHAQKPFNDYRSRVDFFVYGKNHKFGIDVFYADNINSFQGCINAKQKIYNDANFDVVFLSANLSIS